MMVTTTALGGAPEASPGALPGALLVVALVFMFSFLAWFAGLLVVGAPNWWLFHKLGVRSPWVAAAWGAVVTGGAIVGLRVWALASWAPPLDIVKESLPSAAVLAMFGGVIGWAVVTRAYKRQGVGQ